MNRIPTINERRFRRRTEVDLPVRFRVMSENRAEEGVGVDVSSGGVAIQSNTRLQVGDQLEVELELLVPWEASDEPGDGVFSPRPGPPVSQFARFRGVVRHVKPARFHRVVDPVESGIHPPRWEFGVEFVSSLGEGYERLVRRYIASVDEGEDARPHFVEPSEPDTAAHQPSR